MTTTSQRDNSLSSNARHKPRINSPDRTKHHADHTKSGEINKGPAITPGPSGVNRNSSNAPGGAGPPIINRQQTKHDSSHPAMDMIGYMLKLRVPIWIHYGRVSNVCAPTVRDLYATPPAVNKFARYYKPSDEDLAHPCVELPGGNVWVNPSYTYAVRSPEQGSGQIPGETWQEFRQRCLDYCDQVFNSNISLEDSAMYLARFEQRPSPFDCKINVYYWPRIDKLLHQGYRIQTKLKQNQILEQWELHAPSQHKYNGTFNKWDICTEFDPDTKLEDMADETSKVTMQSTNDKGGFYDVYHDIEGGFDNVYDDNHGGLHVEGAKHNEQILHNDKPACQSHKPAEVMLGFWREDLLAYEFNWHDNILGCVSLEDILFQHYGLDDPAFSGDSPTHSVWDVAVKELLEFSSPPVHPKLCPLAMELMQSFKNLSVQLPPSLAHAWDLVSSSPTSLQDYLPSLMFMVCKYEAAPKEYYYELVSTEIPPTFGDT
ncbi:hypothetical protein M422DRAFT_264430 [Sphaerobolus stellatus SS14]|uniref:Uncharacterized protein n=1 Tax=Sphaerobolus stellatus (strain SS14) TaxID=990650 RepID=A0A0C9V7V7_SPHS4|nr:hypothetical protein M422DRAFT_264430 [Sphaerobolus stellatus SS14]